MIKQRRDEITTKAKEMIDNISSNRCKTCTLPRPCRHHERELYRAGLSDEALEKEIQRDERSPKSFRKKPEFENDPFRVENSIILQPSID